MSTPPPPEGILAALRNPLRRAILRKMWNKDDPLSPTELADLLDEPLSNVSYHVRVLRRHKAVLMVDEKPVRGSVEHFYEMTLDEPWALEVLGLKEDRGGDG